MSTKPSNKPHNTSLGLRGEQIAAAYLRSQGYTILDRNFRARPGEIDLIVRNKTSLVFVEVKTRQSAAFGTPEEAVTPRKLQEVKDAAMYYVATHPGLPEEQHIAVVAIMMDPATDQVASLTFHPSVTL
jgi:putative endonuclease